MLHAKHSLVTAVLFFVCLIIFGSVETQAGKKLQDQLGRQIQISGDLKRVIPLAPSIAEYIYLLGKWNKVVGISKFTDFPSQTENLPKVGSYVNLDLEKIVSLDPDLCFATKDGNPKSLVRELEQLGISVYALDPRNMSAIEQTLLKLGQLLDSEDRAKKMLQRINKQLTRVKGLVQKAPSKPRVFFQIGISPIVSAGKNTIVHELIEIAGGKNVVESKKPYPRFSREEVLLLKPEIIVVSSMTNKKENFKKAKGIWSGFESIPAVKTGRIYSVNSALVNRPSPRIIKGLRKLFKIFHSDLADQLTPKKFSLN